MLGTQMIVPNYHKSLRLTHWVCHENFGPGISSIPQVMVVWKARKILTNECTSRYRMLLRSVICATNISLYSKHLSRSR